MCEKPAAKKKAEVVGKKSKKQKVEKEGEQNLEDEGKNQDQKKPKRRLRKAVDKVPEKDESVEPAPKNKVNKRAAEKTQEGPETKNKRVKNTAKSDDNDDEKSESKALEESNDDDDMMKTPKKTLFHSDDDCDDGESVWEPSRKKKPAGKHDTKQKKIKNKEVQKEASGASKEQESEEDAEEKSKTKKSGKGKAKVKSPKGKKGELSPFAKKEAMKRKKKADIYMREGAVEDLQIQGILLECMKRVELITEEKDVKTYLTKNMKDQEVNKKFALNEYWTRPAVGVTCKEIGKAVAYFGKVGTCPSGWNINIALVYAGASLMVSKLPL